MRMPGTLPLASTDDKIMSGQTSTTIGMDDDDNFEKGLMTTHIETSLASSDKDHDVDTKTRESNEFKNLKIDNSDLSVCSESDRTNDFETDVLIDSKELHEQHQNIAGTLEDDTDNLPDVKVAKAPDGGWGWFIVLGCISLRTILGGLGRSHGLFYIQFLERYGGSATSTALVMSLVGFVRLGTGPIVSVLCNRVTCRTLTGIGTCLLFIGVLATGYAPNLVFTYFSFSVVGGLGRAFILTPVPVQLGCYFDKRRSLVFGLSSAGMCIGGIAITPVVELLFENFGFQGTFLVLSAFVTHVFISTFLFRPIELQRKFMDQDRRLQKVDQMSSVADMEIQKFISINNSTSSLSNSECVTKTQQMTSSQTMTTSESELQVKNNINEIERNNCTNAAVVNNDTTENEQTVKSKTGRFKETNAKCLDPKVDIENRKDRDKDATPLDTKECKQSITQPKSEDVTDNKKKKLIRWSIMKDVRFLSYLFASVCFTLPTWWLFLPALAKSRGVLPMQAASLLSANAAFEIFSSVIAGFVLDKKMFRNRRPIIFNLVIYIQALLQCLYPFMTSYRDFFILCAIDGVFAGVRTAQGFVIVLDMLGADRFASSMAVTMAVNCVSVFIGPTIAGQLKDIYGTYNGAYYFAAGSLLTGAVVLTIGNMWKHFNDKDKKLSKDAKSTKDEKSTKDAKNNKGSKTF